MPRNPNLPPPPPNVDRGIQNLLKEGLTGEALAEYLEAHTGEDAADRDEKIVRYLLKNGKETFVAEHFALFQLSGRFPIIARLAQGSVETLNMVALHLGDYLRAWKKQGDPYTEAQAKRLGNFLIAVLNARFSELGILDEARFADMDEGGTDHDDWQEHVDQPGSFTLMRGLIYRALLDEYPKVALDANAELESFERKKK